MMVRFDQGVMSLQRESPIQVEPPEVRLVNDSLPLWPQVDERDAKRPTAATMLCIGGPQNGNSGSLSRILDGGVTLTIQVQAKRPNQSVGARSAQT